ncbi:MAG: SusC/RagA family TonB-linked outer membrane protein, partial [Bacteroidetes bacterium]|nr:SusC/RagA family TonB-linked outer membrane protein [Bacteroidota bacterium]
MRNAILFPPGLRCFRKPLVLIILFTSFINFIATAQSSDRSIRGRVTDESNAPLAGVTITAPGTRKFSTTDAEGNFSITVKSGTRILKISYVGYAEKEIAIGSESSISVSLTALTKQLNDVVVTGYGKSSKRNITGSITSIPAEDFNQGVINSPAQLLQGKVAGLNIAKSGDPNGSPTVILRGPSTFREGGAQDPFYVIDGVPGASLDMVAPADIVSIDVLKDASSTAIYGARAANGVIMVTTRRGKNGPARLSYNSYVALEKVSKRIDMLSGDELRKYLKDNNQVLNQYNDSGANTNWQKAVQRDGISHNHNLAFSGGTNKTTYGASLNYLNQQGIIKTSGQEKLIFKLNMDQRFFDDRLKLSLLLANSNYTIHDIPKDQLFGNMLVYMPTVNVHRPDGTYTEDFSRGGYLNPVSLIETNTDVTKGKSTLMNALAEVKIIKGLQYTLSLSSQSIQNNRGVYYASNSGLALGTSIAPNTGGKAYRSSYENTDRIIESYFNYDVSFGEHNIKLLGGYSWQQKKTNDGFGVGSQGFNNDLLSYNNLSLGYPGNIANIPLDNPDISTLRLISYYARVNYQFGDRYLFQASIRNDGSSAFGKNKQWGYFPAASAGWRISREPFMQHVSWVDDLKLRAGYGVSGNSFGFNAFSSILRYGPAGTYYNNGLLLTAFAPVQNENPDLKWESTAT